MRAAILAAGLGLGLPVAASAQGELPEPAEPPPAEFARDAYVDSAGCGFLRVLVRGEPVWAPRFRLDGSRLCGLQPSIDGSGGSTERSAETVAGATDAASLEEPASVSEPAEARPRPPGFYVQAGAFGRLETALEIRNRFLAQGWAAETEPAGPWTAVFAGPFEDEDAARAALGQIRRQGMPDAFLLRQD